METDARRATGSQPVVSMFMFQPDRLRQARQLALMTKADLAKAGGVTPSAIGQYESGVSTPRPDTLARLAKALGVDEAFFAAGRPLQRLEVSDTYFESLRSTTAKQRLHATAFAEQLWEISHALETYVRFPDVNLPDAPDGPSGPERAREAAQAVRTAWGLGVEPIGHLVSHVESNGVIAALAPRTEQAKARIDAYSTLTFGRPLMVLTPDRADDVFRHRFSAAHELGHLVLHGGEVSGDVWLEKEADAFAAELLTPSSVIAEVLPRRLNFALLSELAERWGVSIKMLVFRSQELGLISESTSRRAYVRLSQNPVQHRPIRLYDGEVPRMLRAAFELAETQGLTQVSLADQLGWKPRRVRELLGDDDPRPLLKVLS